ncbi:hypothetical protein Hanom_Chr11g00968971 [Helianthus anomalus]
MVPILVVSCIIVTLALASKDAEAKALNFKNKVTYKIKSEFQGLSFIFIPIFRRCPLCSKLTSFVLYVFISYTFCPLGLAQLVFSVKFGHVLCT